MNSWYIDKKTGLGSFKELEEKFGVRNFVTYDNEIWGNMLATFAKGEDELLEISNKDHKLMDMIGTTTLFALSVPPEDTFLHLDMSSYRLLTGSSKPEEKYIEKVLKANAIVIDDEIEDDFEIVVAPGDCAIVTLVHPDWRGIVIIHLGFPQIYQNLHIKVMRYLKALKSELDFTRFSAFVTPYICGEHYSIDEEKYAMLDEADPARDLLKYCTKRHHEILNEERYFVDIGKYLNDYFKNIHGITEYYESGLCTYEEVENGNLFSHRHQRENAKDGDESYKRGRFNTVFRYPGRAV